MQVGQIQLTPSCIIANGRYIKSASDYMQLPTNSASKPIHQNSNGVTLVTGNQ